VAVSWSGERDTAASWTAHYDGRAQEVRGQTSLHDTELRALEVVTFDGARLVTVPVR
jgi:hypothetical protein